MGGEEGNFEGEKREQGGNGATMDLELRPYHTYNTICMIN